MRQAICVLDLFFGDSGKGSVTDALVRTTGAKAVCRFSGGCNASHTVITTDSRAHCFSQFGSGMFVDGVDTLLTEDMMVNPLSMMLEEEHLRKKGVTDAFRRTKIDGAALITTPYHRSLNRIRELSRGDAFEGSTGKGIGETKRFWLEHGCAAPTVGDLLHSKIIREKLEFVRSWVAGEVTKLDRRPYRCAAMELELHDIADTAWFEVILEQYGLFLETGVKIVPRLKRPKADTVIFEGSQGILLDEWKGLHPFTTWSAVTSANAWYQMFDWNFDGDVKEIGVTRCYATRHGPGPFPTEDKDLRLTDPYNPKNAWQKQMRFGWLDLVALRYAITCNEGIDGIALTHMDVPLDVLNVCVGYDVDGEEVKELTPPLIRDLKYQEKLTNIMQRAKPLYVGVEKCQLAEFIRYALGVPVWIVSSGPTWKDKEFLVDWFGLRTENLAGMA